MASSITLIILKNKDAEMKSECIREWEMKVRDSNQWQKQDDTDVQ